MIGLGVTDERDGSHREVRLQSLPVMLGRGQTCAVALPDKGVSHQHAEISCRDGVFFVEDMGSTNLTFLNGKQLPPRKPTEIKSGDRIRICQFVVTAVLDGEAEQAADYTPIQSEASAEVDRLFEFKRQVRVRLLERLNLRKTENVDADDPEFRALVKTRLDEILDGLESAVPTVLTRSELLRELIDDVLGLGPIEDALRDPQVTEVMVNHHDEIYVEKAGRLYLYGKRFYDEQQILNVIQRIVQPIGKRVDEASPMVDARLKDGSRVHAIIPPLALRGPTLTIRKFSEKKLGASDLIEYGSVDERMVKFLALIVEQRANVVVSGGTGSGKTTLLNVLSNFIPDGERIITVEDTAELKLNKQHVVPLEARASNIEGKGEVTIRDLVRATLRMRPDRIVVGECRGGEALDMLQAMNTGHDGSLTTVHANSPRDTLSRLETLVMMAKMELPSRAIREQISSAINFVVQTSRQSDGSRKVTHITEITGMEGDVISAQDIFVFRQQGFNEKHHVLGTFAATGNVPRFAERLDARGIPVDVGMFAHD